MSDHGPSGQLLLYHGTPATFEVFDRKRVRTAKHLYLTDDVLIASTYGKCVYRVQSDLGNHLSLHPENIGPECARVLKSTFEAIGADFGYEDFETFVFDITGAEGKLYGIRGRFQDALFDEIFSLGFHSLSFPDPALDRGWAMSYVFEDPARLKILGQIDGACLRECQWA